MLFKWHPDERPPSIEPHSKAKLEVLRGYLRAYFDRLNSNPVREEFKLDLVDGFSGGGLFLDGISEISGTPLIMLEEAKQAKERLNENRTKRLNINCKFYFVDKEKAHTDHLRKILRNRDNQVENSNIVIRNGLFKNEVIKIIASIKKRQPRSGRAIFLLDQTGFSQVELDLVSYIFKHLANAEVILTFAADALINHLTQDPHMIRAVAPIQLTNNQLEELVEQKHEKGGKALVQRALRDHIRSKTKADYDTPFFIRPKKSRRALWFLHLSRHPTARDVMVQQHWNIHNTFEHYGRGDLNMLGWDVFHNTEAIPLFDFSSLDQEQLKIQLMDSLPKELFPLITDQPVTIDAVQQMLANRTAARFSDLHQIIMELVREQEFEILNAEGRVRHPSIKRLNLTDRITLPRTLLFPEFSRRK